MGAVSNGQTAEWVRWIAAGILAALVSYFTAVGTTRERVAALEAAEAAHFAEIQRALADIKADLRELKNRRGGGGFE